MSQACEVSFVLTCAENCDQGPGCHLVVAKEPRRAFAFFFAVEGGTNDGARGSQGGQLWMRTPHCALEVCEECEVSFVSTCADNCDQRAGCHLVLRRAVCFV